MKLSAKETIAEINKDPHPYMALLLLFSFYGLRADKIINQVTEFKIDESWTVKINGNETTVENIPPFCFMLKYHGWPAGVMSPDGSGVMANGQGANEGTLIEAILKRLGAEDDASPDSISE